jgi:hypothetical protein
MEMKLFIQNKEMKQMEKNQVKNLFFNNLQNNL